MGLYLENALMKWPRHFFKIRRRLLSLGVVLLVAGGMISLAIGAGVSPGEIHQLLGGYPAVVVFGAMVLLPIFGFSIAVIYLLAGARFGAGLGLVLIAIATAAHLVCSHWLARTFLRRPMERLLTRRKIDLSALPPGENASMALVVAIIPGLPYFARNYLLALAGIPLRRYFWICLPIYVLRSALAILLGDLGEDITAGKILILAGALVVKLVVCGVIIKRLRDRHVGLFARKKTAEHPRPAG